MSGFVERLAEELRDLEYAWSCSPTGPDRDSVEWARMRVEALLGSVVEQLGSPAAIAEAEPHVEAVVEDALRGKDPAPAARVAKRAIHAACVGAGMAEDKRGARLSEDGRAEETQGGARRAQP